MVETTERVPLDLLKSPRFRLRDYSNLGASIILILASLFTAYKVFKGSKNTFAYTLLAFTFLLGLVKIGLFFMGFYPYYYSYLD